MATLNAGDDFNIAGPLGHGFTLDPQWKNIVVLGRGVGLATLAPLSQLAKENGVGVTAILSARSPDVVMSRDVFEAYGAKVITVVDTDKSSDVGNVEKILAGLIAEKKADAFFTCPPEPWRSRHGDQPFILCVGAVQRRKQQALLLRAANAARLPVVLIGPVLPGEHAYGEQVAVAARENATLGGRWIPGLAAADPLLMSAYGNCRMFVLLSQEETQPLSVLQALAARKPVLLSMAGYVANEPFAGLPVVPTTNVETVAAALRRAWEEARPTALERSYSWHAVAEQLLALYRAAVGVHGGT